jgi:pyridoxal/pyridoxine/pyridoxamine kinase
VRGPTEDRVRQQDVQAILVGAISGFLRKPDDHDSALVLLRQERFESQLALICWPPVIANISALLTKTSSKAEYLPLGF